MYITELSTPVYIAFEGTDNIISYVTNDIIVIE